MRGPATFLALAALLAVTAALGVFLGGSALPARDIVDALLHPGGDGMAQTVVWQLRIPRVLRALVVGSSLAGCGVVFQAVLRNPLAEPYTLGVSAVRWAPP
jgi:iron complex transport system permease protein